MAQAGMLIFGALFQDGTPIFEDFRKEAQLHFQNVALAEDGKQFSSNFTIIMYTRLPFAINNYFR